MISIAYCHCQIILKMEVFEAQFWMAHCHCGFGHCLRRSWKMLTVSAPQLPGCQPSPLAYALCYLSMAPLAVVRF